MSSRAFNKRRSLAPRTRSKTPWRRCGYSLPSIGVSDLDLPSVKRSVEVPNPDEAQPKWLNEKTRLFVLWHCCVLLYRSVDLFIPFHLRARAHTSGPKSWKHLSNRGERRDRFSHPRSRSRHDNCHMRWFCLHMHHRLPRRQRGPDGKTTENQQETYHRLVKRSHGTQLYSGSQ